MKQYKITCPVSNSGRIGIGYQLIESPDGNLIELEPNDQVISFNYINANENGKIINLPNEEMQVLALLPSGFELLWYNEHHECFDDFEGDDYKYNIEQIIKWAELPKE